MAALDEDGSHIEKHKRELYKALLEDFADLPKASKNMSYDDYAVVNVAPSVVPNPYLPSFRIFTYNITGTPYDPRRVNRGEVGMKSRDLQSALCTEPSFNSSWGCRLTQPWHSNPDSPSRTNRLWSALGYAQVGICLLYDLNSRL